MPSPALTEDDLKQVVEAFYTRVRADPLLGPIFNGAIHDWPDHLDNLQAFWSSVMLTSGRYKGQPMVAHARHESAITPEAFARWLELWRTTTDALVTPEAAAALQEKASRIAESIALGIDFYRNRARDTPARS
ncbi:group III truncated hemoglobin [Sphingomonas psychrotolerans]|uniref:Group III truncated hemoglobin n=1 Tax=Sphingomonas psychrotolerans TaxID=1327635 RepID=A0ABU3N7B1_9SPHN|nr:group III truncated hemoglobin [Sphingomonas psychrotolerans]MDT8760399.1 group III truncated hemoglobin [Sphingomonas psychrotolerans]